MSTEMPKWDCDRFEDEGDLGDCPYFMRGLPGADPEGCCSYGCVDEPSCMTDRPLCGWPSEGPCGHQSLVVPLIYGEGA